MPIDNEGTDIIFGINPVREALRADLPIERAYVHNPTGTLGSLTARIRKLGIPVIEVAEQKLNALCPATEKEPNHQGIVVRIAAAAYVFVDELLGVAAQRQEDPFLLMLDGITDTQNFGAILRSAEAMGVHGVIIPKRRSAGLIATVFRASSGAAAHIGVAQVTNLATTIQRLKDKGLWIVGTQAQADPCYSTNLTGGIVLCIGSEGSGLSRLTRERCDFMVGIPLFGKTQSLNAACAASVCIYEIQRQRRSGRA